MFKTVLAQWKIYAAVALILLVAFLLFQWKSTKADLAVTKAENASVIVKKDSVIINNVEQVKKLEVINKDNAQTAVVQKKAEVKKEAAQQRVAKVTAKVEAVKTDIIVNEISKVDSGRQISAEGVAVLQELADQMDAQLDAEQTDTTQLQNGVQNES